MARKFNYVHLFKNCRLFLSADTCFCDQFEMMHRGKFEQSRTKLKTITSFISICFQSRASIFFVEKYFPIACMQDIRCLLLSTMITMNKMKEQ